MTRRRNNTAVASTDVVTVVESIPMELEDSTVAEYQKLSEKQDTVMSKIKSRKEERKK